MSENTSPVRSAACPFAPKILLSCSGESSLRNAEAVERPASCLAPRNDLRNEHGESSAAPSPSSGQLSRRQLRDRRQSRQLRIVARAPSDIGEGPPNSGPCIPEATSRFTVAPGAKAPELMLSDPGANTNGMAAEPMAPARVQHSLLRGYGIRDPRRPRVPASSIRRGHDMSRRADLVHIRMTEISLGDSVSVIFGALGACRKCRSTGRSAHRVAIHSRRKAFCCLWASQ